MANKILTYCKDTKKQPNDLTPGENRFSKYYNKIKNILIDWNNGQVIKSIKVIEKALSGNKI